MEKSLANDIKKKTEIENFFNKNSLKELENFIFNEKEEIFY